MIKQIRSLAGLLLISIIFFGINGCEKSHPNIILINIDDMGWREITEVAPPLDPSGTTALNGATILFEMLCVMASARTRM